MPIWEHTSISALYLVKHKKAEGRIIMNKKKYENPETEIIMLQSEDVILASPELDEYEGEPVNPSKP